MTHASIQHTTNVQQDAMSASSANQSGQRRRYVVQVQTNAPREMSDDCAGRALWPQVGQTSKKIGSNPQVSRSPDDSLTKHGVPTHCHLLTPRPQSPPLPQPSSTGHHRTTPRLQP